MLVDLPRRNQGIEHDKTEQQKQIGNVSTYIPLLENTGTLRNRKKRNTPGKGKINRIVIRKRAGMIITIQLSGINSQYE